MASFRLSSPEFDDGDPLPDRTGYTAENVNPPLTIEGVPEGTRSLALIMDDPDAMEPAGKIWDHWLVWDIPPDQGSIPEAWSADSAAEGINDYGEEGYGGPNPPDREHTYRFRLYAVDTTLDLPSGADRDTVEEALDGHVLDDTLLEGTYAPDTT